MSIEQLKNNLSDLRINATQALQQYYSGKRIGHIVSVLMGTKI